MRKPITVVILALATLALATFMLAQSQNVQITQGPTVESVNDHSAVLAWSTNVNASTIVRYGTDQNHLDKSAKAPWGGLTHRVTIDNLQPGTTYYFVVRSGQGQGTGTSALSNAQSFTTQGGNAGQPQSDNQQQNLSASCSNITATSFDVTWNTSRPGSSVVKFSTDANNLSQISQAPWGQSNHKVTVSNLQPGTKYFYQVQTEGEQGTGAKESSQTLNCTTNKQ